MQSTAGQSFPDRVHQQKMKRRRHPQNHARCRVSHPTPGAKSASEDQSKRPIRRGIWNFAGLAAPLLDL
jgi:hypothetical protein